ncbi:MAG: ABC transporter substrate-binding protein [Proteobacteria bacterium]|nr:ABC transporter substrate-binding protein [Pseudomonadota bacterium]MBU4035465.1 ABC transporter substrate-binding protein [Pseudomonadota bacterium]
MIKYLYIFTILIFLFFCSGLAWARQEVVIVQSSRVQPYEDAIQGFKSVCDAQIKRLIISELQGADVVREIDKISPDIVLAIGIDALSKVKRIKNIPVIYVMVLNPWSILSGETNIGGVNMNIPQEEQLVVLLSVMPEIKAIGLLYNKNKTGHLAKEIKNAAGKFSVKLVTKEVYNSKDVPQLLTDMKGKIDVFWMLPDLTVITPETVEFMLLFSLENKIPILAFSEKYVEMGALMSISVDAFDMGSQAGEIANKILTGSNAMNTEQVDARKTIISINLKAAKKLGITIKENILRKARIIN